MTLPHSVRLVEVGPRDGLQNEKEPISVADKVRLVDDLSAAGLSYIEVGSFVSPKWVPQMAGSAEVFAQIQRKAGVTYAALTPNMKGLEAAIEAGVKEVAVFGAASEAFSQKNINCSIAESLARFAPLMEAAREQDIRVRGYVSCVLGCPFDGEIKPKAVADLAVTLWELGCYEISLGDTIGVGTPLKAREMLRAVGAELPVANLAMHFHDTYGQALANLYAGMEEGVRVIDAAAGGLGGCPYAPGATGNVATEDVAYMLEGMGVTTGIDMDKLLATTNEVATLLGRPPVGRVASALNAKRKRLGGS